MFSTSLMLKTVRGCNAACRYCYTEDDHALCLEVMDTVLATDIVAQQMALVAGRGEVSFGWQGGEPTLAGLAFFERVLEAEGRLAPDGTVISNDLQTNGLRVDDAWAELFSTYRFLVGLSVDGPRHLHDAVRKDRTGRGTFDRALRAFECLALRGVDVNALCVVGPHNVDHAADVIGFFAFAGFTHVQIVPAMGFSCREPDALPGYLVSAAQYGQFLVDLLEAWSELPEPRPVVQVIEDAVRAAHGWPPSVCTHAPACNAGLVIDTNGDAYPCDFFQSPDRCLGNVRNRRLEEIASDPLLLEFAARKAALPQACQSCPFLELCRGGCPRNRPTGGKADALCEAYRVFYGKVRGIWRTSPILREKE